MEARFINGAIVSRYYREDGAGELLAAFAYASSAQAWAKRQAREDHAAGMATVLVATCTHSGKSWAFWPPAAETPA